MTDDIIEMFLLSLNIISIVILGYLIISRYRHKITLVGFWKNILILITLLFISKVAVFFGYFEFGELVFVIFSFMAMLIMVVSFVLHYPMENKFEAKKSE